MSPKLIFILCCIGVVIKKSEEQSVQDILNIISGANAYAECSHMTTLIKLWQTVHHQNALQTLYEYIVAHINSPKKPCCIQGVISDALEAFQGGLWWIPNMRRMKERVDYSGRRCKEYLISLMETSMGVHRVSHLNHNTTAQSHPPHTYKTTTVKPTTTTSVKSTTTSIKPTTTSIKITTSTTTQALTTTQQTVHNTTLTGIRCPSCDMNLNCVWSNVCQISTQSCLVRSFPGYPFSTHCAERQDCLLMKQLASSGEIYCCDDESCIHKILGV